MPSFVEHYAKTIISTWFIFVLVAEIINPNFAKIFNNTRFVKNLALGFLVKIIMPIITIYFFIKITQFYIFSYKQTLLKYLIDFIFLDIALYVFHVVAHKVKFIWKFHEIHHLDNDVDASTGIRIHFFEPVTAFVFKLPIIFLFSISLESYVFYEVSLTIIGILHHSNFKFNPRIQKLLSYLITMPELHLIHHHAIVKDTNSNYGFVFSFWDRIFKTYNTTKIQSDWNFGLKYSKDKKIKTLLFYPFLNKNLRNLI